MRIGIIVHSDTGNTLQVAETLRAKLVAAGHQAAVEQLKALGDPRPGDMNSQPAALPDLSGYQGLVFAAPVHAFRLSALMRNTLPQVAGVQGKPVALYVTEGFPFPWMGGQRAVRQMAGLVEKQGGLIKGTGVINWPKQAVQAPLLTDRLAKLF